jgi:hypothetical protein
MRRSPPSVTSSPDLWEAIAQEAKAESPLWGEALLPKGQRESLAVFSRLCEQRFALGLETIYEGYLVHYGRPRLFATRDPDSALLLGDYLYAHGLVRVAAEDDVRAVADLAELISLVSHMRAEGDGDDGAAWAAVAARLGRASDAPADEEAVADVLAAHRLRVV